jgi:multisubunit Na+/H+ antiporter MnhE subunit
LLCSIRVKPGTLVIATSVGDLTQRAQREIRTKGTERSLGCLLCSIRVKPGTLVITTSVGDLTQRAQRELRTKGTERYFGLFALRIE